MSWIPIAVTLALAAGMLSEGGGSANDQSQAASAAAKKPQAYLGLEFYWAQDPSRDKFLHVERVAPNGPAYQAGLRPGDIITHIAGVRVGFGDDLDFLIFMRDRDAGERLVLTVVRSGRSLKMVATLGALPEAARATWEKGFRVAQQRRTAATAAQRAKSSRDSSRKQ